MRASRSLIISTTRQFSGSSAASFTVPTVLAHWDIAALTHEDHSYLNSHVNVSDFPCCFEATMICLGPMDKKAPVPIVVIRPRRNDDAPLRGYTAPETSRVFRFNAGGL